MSLGGGSVRRRNAPGPVRPRDAAELPRVAGVGATAHPGLGSPQRVRIFNVAKGVLLATSIVLGIR